MPEPNYDDPQCFQSFHECTEQRQWELYKEKRDAMQSLVQRLDALEARLDALEKRRKSNTAEAGSESKDGPVATPLGLQHCGRSLFRVDGKSGVWCGKRDIDEYDTETVYARQAEKRGRPRMKRLYRLNALSEEMATMFQQKEEGQRHGAGSAGGES